MFIVMINEEKGQVELLIYTSKKSPIRIKSKMKLKNFLFKTYKT